MRRQHETGCAWRRALASLAIAALAAFALAACGGDDDDDGGDTAATAPATTATTGAGGSTVAISTPPGSDLAFEQKDASATAGPVTIDFDNQQATPHDVKVEDPGGQELGGTELISSSTASATVDLQPGTYTFFCSVPGHREAGMEGMLTVK